MLIKQLNNGKYAILKDNRLQKLYTCLEEIQLWKGENPFDIDAGVDYFAIFENRAFIETELVRVLDKHKEAYQKYSIENLGIDDQNRILLNLIFTIDESEAYRVNLAIGDRS